LEGIEELERNMRKELFKKLVMKSCNFKRNLMKLAKEGREQKNKKEYFITNHAVE